MNEMTTVRKISKNRFLSDPARGRKPGVCPAKIVKWTAYLSSTNIYFLSLNVLLPIGFSQKAFNIKEKFTLCLLQNSDKLFKNP